METCKAPVPEISRRVICAGSTSCVPPDTVVDSSKSTDFAIGLVDNIVATILICQRLVIMQSTFSLQIVHYTARWLANCFAHRDFVVPSAGNLHIDDKQVTK